MTRKISLKKFAAFFSLLCGATYGVIYACAGWFWGYDYDSSFTPEAYVDQSYAPLFFSSQDFFYGIGYDDNHVSRFNEPNTHEWADYLKEKMPLEKVKYYLLSDSATEDIRALYDIITKKQPLPPHISNVNDEKVRSFIEFLHYARQIELSSSAPAYSWDYDEHVLPPVDPRLMAEVKAMYERTNDPFLKNRYWFQTMKAMFYSEQKHATVEFFEKTKNDVPLNTLYYRGMSYVAGVHYRNRNYAASNYLYSVVFDKCAPLRTTAAYNFHPQEQSDFNASLAMAKTNQEKAALWALLGYYADEKTAIREIYKIDPLSAHLDFLLTRLVNKEEVRLNATAFTSAEDYKQTMKANIDKDVLQLVTNIAREEKTGKPHLWNMAAGYLNILAGNATVASQIFQRSAKRATQDGLAANQERLLQLINVLYGINRMDDAAEKKLLDDLRWLYHLEDSDGVFRRAHAIEWSKRYIASLYQSQGETVLAELFYPQKKFYYDDANTEKMKAFLSTKEKSPWEQMAVSIYNFSLSDIYEYQAVINAYKGNIDEAIVLMEKSDEGKNVLLLANPFNGRIKDCHDCEHQSPQKVAYSKLSFLKKIKEMQANVEALNDIYNNALLVGNAFYNMSYFGNARVFYYGDIINQYGNYIDTFYQPYLLSCDKAKAYYQTAFETAQNNEQRAKCTYLIAKCERNEFYTKTYHSDESFYGDPEVAFLAWPGFQKLKAEYADTKYYKEVISECGYFRKYANKN